MAATNRRLAADVGAGRFREDLYYRLNVIPIGLPTLAERAADVPLLVAHLVARSNQRNDRNVNLTPAAMEVLKGCPWPGNIRQLSNVVERIVLLADKVLVEREDLVRFLPEASEQAGRTPYDTGPGAAATLSYGPATSHTGFQLEEALRASGGNRSRAAQHLGMTVRQFTYRLKKQAGPPDAATLA